MELSTNFMTGKYEKDQPEDANSSDLHGFLF